MMKKNLCGLVPKYLHPQLKKPSNGCETLLHIVDYNKSPSIKKLNS